jgi:RNA-directed DNA polymerase
LEGDIKKCFDEINHDWLMKHIPMEKAMLSQWLKSGFVEDGVLYPTRKGTPQGGIISPVLANMTLDGLESILNSPFGKKGTRKRKKYGIHAIRYADDFVITGHSKEVLETQVKPMVENFLAERGLALSAEKTQLTHITSGFDFLSQNVRKCGSKIIIKPSKKSIANLLKNVRHTVLKSRAITQTELIKRLNPQIRGWTFYHRHMCARKVFEKVDHEIYTCLWNWSKRRHPNKGLQWIKEKYFKTKESRNWCFGAFDKNGNRQEWHELFKASDVPIRRRIKVRGEANPFDKTWYPYFEARRGNTTIGANRSRHSTYA